MSKLSKEQIAHLESFVHVSYMLSETLRLMCDGDVISLRECPHKRKLRVIMFVNGKLCGKWLSEHSTHRESKYFLRDIRTRKCKFDGKPIKIDLGYKSDFDSAGQALRHLNKVCDVIQVHKDSVGSVNIFLGKEVFCE